MPLLTVVNHADSPVLLLDGEELVGALQDRVLNSTVLLPAHAWLMIPVNCVEEGRWGSRSPAFPGRLPRRLAAEQEGRLGERGAPPGPGATRATRPACGTSCSRWRSAMTGQRHRRHARQVAARRAREVGWQERRPGPASTQTERPSLTWARRAAVQWIGRCFTWSVAGTCDRGRTGFFGWPGNNASIVLGRRILGHRLAPRRVARVGPSHNPWSRTGPEGRGWRAAST